jgi:HK97 family phage prohead protease
LARTIAHRRNTFEVRLDHHDGDRVGLVQFSEWSDGLRFRAELEPDQESIIAEVRDGDRKGVSVRFRALQVEPLPDRDGLRAEEIIQAKLRELSLTRAPQYADAGVDTIRHAAEAAAAEPSEAIKAALAAVERYKTLEV